MEATNRLRKSWMNWRWWFNRVLALFIAITGLLAIPGGIFLFFELIRRGEVYRAVYKLAKLVLPNFF